MTSNTIDNDRTMSGSEGTLLAGRYRIVRQLGQGGMGSVWLAEDTQLDNKQFAIKMLPSILVSNKRAYAQLKSEALVAMKLVHPNIVQIRAFEENEGNPFLVMDYIDGQTLDDYLAEKGKLGENETIRLLKPIASALDYAHSKGVVHRDVKPGNIMLSKDGVPFILDFGISREMQETMTRVTGKFSSGTLLYMSPEQLNGAQPRLEQDVYSFAVVVYECLKGEPPFCRGQVDRQILENDPEPLPDGVADLRFAASVMSGLAKDPAARPRSCVGLLLGRPAATRAEGASQVGAGAGAGDTRRRTAIKIAESKRPLAAGASVRQRKISAIALAAALVVAVVGVVGYSAWSSYDMHVKSVRAAEEEVRRKNAEEEQKRVIALSQKAEMEAVYAKASGRRAVVAGIKKADGFERLIRDFDGLFGEADAFRTAQRFSDAAMAYTNALQTAETIVRQDAERGRATVSRSNADAARQTAEKASASVYAPSSWNAATNDYCSAESAMAKMGFAVARGLFDSAATRFLNSAEEAIGEKSRLGMEKARESAMAQWNKVLSINDKDGFAVKKENLRSAYELVGQCATEKRWEEASKKYEAFEGACSRLISLDAERNEAVAARSRASKACAQAEGVGAKQYVPKQWNAVLTDYWNVAEEYFKKMDFRPSQQVFDEAAIKYRECERVANAAKQREAERLAKEEEQRRLEEEKKRLAKEAAEKRRRELQSLPGRWKCSTILKMRTVHAGKAVVNPFPNQEEYTWEFSSDGTVSETEKGWWGEKLYSVRKGRWSLSGDVLTMNFDRWESHTPNAIWPTSKVSVYTDKRIVKCRIVWHEDGSFTANYLGEKPLRPGASEASRAGLTFTSDYDETELRFRRQ